jgi:hypothetical protein
LIDEGQTIYTMHQRKKKEDEWRLVSYVDLLHDGHPNRAEMAKL